MRKHVCLNEQQVQAISEADVCLAQIARDWGHTLEMPSRAVVLCADRSKSLLGSDIAQHTRSRTHALTDTSQSYAQGCVYSEFSR